MKYFVPEKYDLELKINKFDKVIGGVVKVTGEVLAEVIKFHAVKLKISKVLVNGELAKFKGDGEVLTIFNVTLGEAEVTIFYEGKLNENMQGAYLSTYEYNGKTEIIVATQFESHYAREAFPCIDEPAAKAVFDVEIELPEGSDDMVLLNTPSPRMSTYLLAFVIGRFHGKTVTNKHGVKITTYAALNQDINSVDFANEVAARSLEFYDDNFGVKYPLDRLDQVALPDFEAGAMENWGLVTYRESMLLATSSATLSTRKSIALTVAHELSHQWFGDLVTMEWWDDLWLNESFASVMEYYAVDFIHPEYKIWEGFFTGDALAALRRDIIDGVQSVHQDVVDPEEIATLFDPAIVYAKGARMMLMLIRHMGWEDFCKGLKDYFEKFAYKNARGDDLWKTLQKYDQEDLVKIMHSLIDQPGCPVVETGSEVQRRFLIDQPIGKARKTSEKWYYPKDILAREDMSGHYVLNLSEEEFEKRLSKFDDLNLEEKLRLLIDRDLLSKTDLASSASLLPLVLKFKDETDAAIWDIILVIVSGLKIFFPYNSAEEAEFKNFVIDLVKPGLEKIGLFTKKDDDENTLRLRAILLALDFYAENRENMAKLAEKYDADYSKVDAEIRSDILDAKLYLEPEFVDKYLKAYQNTADPEIKFDLLVAMCLTRNKAALKKVVALLEKPEIVKPQDQLHLFIYLHRNPVVKNDVFNWLVTHWDYIKEMSGEKSQDDYPRYIAAGVRTEEEYERYCEFFEPLMYQPALKRVIKMGINEIKARLELIKADKKAVVQELDKIS